MRSKRSGHERGILSRGSRARAMRRRSLALERLRLATASERPSGAQSRRATPTRTRWARTPRRTSSTVPLRGAAELVENSAAAMSVRQPGVFCSRSTIRETSRCSSRSTRPARTAACGACSARRTSIGNPRRSARARRAAAATSCVYIGDTGDNNGRIRIARSTACAEPDGASAARGTVQRRAAALRVRRRTARRRGDVRRAEWRHRAHHEAAASRPAADVCVRRSCSRLPRSGVAREAVATAALVDSLPIVPGSAPLRLITDASLHPTRSTSPFARTRRCSSSRPTRRPAAVESRRRAERLQHRLRSASRRAKA